MKAAVLSLENVFAKNIRAKLEGRLKCHAQDFWAKYGRPSLGPSMRAVLTFISRKEQAKHIKLNATACFLTCLFDNLFQKMFGTNMVDTISTISCLQRSGGRKRDIHNVQTCLNFKLFIACNVFEPGQNTNGTS